jgi:hypothetical protein
MGEAISFPDIKELREVYKKEKIWSKVKRQLEEEGTIKSEKQGCC